MRERLAAFVTERFPFALNRVLEILEPELGRPSRRKLGAKAITALRAAVRARLEQGLVLRAPDHTPETTPGVAAAARLRQAQQGITDSIDGFFHREAIAASFTPDERLELLRGMVLTRAIDNQLKAFFLGGDVRYEKASFQGKGFRSLGQEAIYAAPLRLRRGPDYRNEDGTWNGDVVAPLIRDLGAALAMRPDAATVRMALNAQMGKVGPPMDGKDLHIGDPSWGILPASAPLSISPLTASGMAMAFALRKEPRVAVAFIGEGGSSLGEWHEAINLCAAHRLPAIFCLQNNQTALSTPRNEQSAVRVFADKAVGYGVPGLTLDGTDPEAIAAAFAWAAERARGGQGPTLIELVAMRMCGHAHHDDMLYLGREPHPSWDYPRTDPKGYTDREAYEFWSRRDPINGYAARLAGEGVIDHGELDRMRGEAEALVAAEARMVVGAPWPDGAAAGTGVFADEPQRGHVEVLEHRSSQPRQPLPAVEPAPAFDSKGRTFLEAVMLGVGDALRSDSRVYVYGQDVGGRYGNAFLLLRPLLDDFAGRILNSPLCEGGILGVCIGSALAGLRASISWSTTPPRCATGGAALCRWSCACRGAACGVPARTTARTRSRGSTARRD
jgi:TPP-dependent pyruvate/acetoin dehydrogenase alpha subunit